MTLIITFSKKKIGKKNFTLDPRHGTLALNMEPSTLDPRQKDRFLKIYASWPHVFDRCVIFAYIIKGRDSENNGFLPGVSLPPSLPPSLLARLYSLAPKTPFPFLFKRLPRRLRKRLRFEISASRVQDLPFSDESVSAQFCNSGEHVLSEFESSLRDKWKQIFSTVKNQGAKKAVEGYLKKKE